MHCEQDHTLSFYVLKLHISSLITQFASKIICKYAIFENGVMWSMELIHMQMEMPSLTCILFSFLGLCQFILEYKAL